MPQISLYIDETTLKKVEQEARREHLSISKWVFEQIKNKIEPRYPADFENLFGSINDEDFVRQDQSSFNNDSRRENL
jgi:hypothetical protein